MEQENKEGMTITIMGLSLKEVGLGVLGLGALITVIVMLGKKGKRK